MQKPAITQQPIHDLIANRWSGRAYDASQGVSQEQVISLLEAARWAPSCFGDQPWRYVVCNKADNLQAWQAAFDCLVPGNQSWAVNAPVLLLICADTLFSHNDKPNKWAPYDTGAATENLCLQATALGLMAHQMGGFDADKARVTFNVPERYQILAMVTVGYQADVESLTGETKERETAARSRKPLNELFFNGQWDQSIV
ncbi:nitroreductase family protein [Methylophilus sp. VKM B-3414]|uniref:nitroreductase family protein n=1 Tax=Methylophilus sp. VKM B-3414 TaxID=3076121 RepID=UPI0028C7A869|nr:nitroreductase family protein [Methylophilus sp. VKM B-3414]MDT7848400.1 nitroreductase family protein [Methylophilus sp. VKM B-3414]